ncbi:MAG TPA: MAPEG family protein [Cellvibrionaceae bacterium]
MVDYNLAFGGILVILITVLAQAMIASFSKARQPGAVPGKIDENLSHNSFVFRSHRTFMNSLENLPLMLGTIFLAILANVNPLWTGICIWVFAISRIIHMLLYYVIATEKNPSPRSLFYGIALMANVALLTLIAITLI